MSSVDTSALKALGTDTKYLFDGPHARLLEVFKNPFVLDEFRIPGSSGSVHIEAPEFTSLCPMTGQPDFATIVLDYEPEEYCVESKSYKLYLGSFRNAGEFHEACIARMGRDLVQLLQPRWLSIEGQFTPRGGIPFWPTFKYSRDHSVAGKWVWQENLSTPADTLETFRAR